VHSTAPITAIVSRGGRPDLASRVLPRIQAATLLIVGGDDDVVIDLNRKAFALIFAPKALEIVPGATHLFEEPGKLEQVAQLSQAWFRRYLSLNQA
jgi:pimeloyl-ACP methyl ester carboxylesterase